MQYKKNILKNEVKLAVITNISKDKKEAIK